MLTKITVDMADSAVDPEEAWGVGILEDEDEGEGEGEGEDWQDLII